MKHISDGIAADLGKMNPDIVEKIEHCTAGGRVNITGSFTPVSVASTADVRRGGSLTPSVEGPATNPRAADRLVPAQTMGNKIGSHRDVTRPSPKAPPTSGSTKPR